MRENTTSEVDRAKEVAQQAGLKHHIRIIGKQEFWDSLPDVMYYMDEPLGDASAVALYFLAEEASRYVKVVLSGEGADELFGGYNIYREPDSLKAVSWIPRGIRRKHWAAGSEAPRYQGQGFSDPGRNECGRAFHRERIYIQGKGKTADSPKSDTGAIYPGIYEAFLYGSWKSDSW